MIAKATVVIVRKPDAFCIEFMLFMALAIPYATQNGT